MSLFEQIALAWQCLGFAFRQLLKPALWTPWLVVGALELLVVGALWWFAHPSVSWFMVPLLSSTHGPDALRYPNLFRVLPELFARADLIIVATLGAVAAGASTRMFASRATGAPAQARAAWMDALRQAMTLMVVNLPLTLIVLLMFYGLDAWLDARGSGGRTRQIAHLLAVIAVFVSQAWLLYVNALVMLARNGWRATLASLPWAASRGLVAALFMAILTLFPLFVLQALAGLGGRMIDRGLPEMAGWLVLAQVIAGLIASFLLTGGAAVFFQSAIAESVEAEAP